ncbi:MAG: radical SAM protein [Chloroflexi bacterium]|nr:radical SAM protein [Chloroflexota bacterium]
MIKLRELDLLLTYACSGRCAHCCYRAGPGRRETMSLAEVESYLEAVADQPLEWILLFGGEPFLCPDLLRASVALAAPLARVLVFTNGCWATDPDTARQRLAGLQAAGLDYILFSVDGFHQAHVVLERVAIGIEAARELGYSTIEIDNRCLGEPDSDNFFNRRTRDDMARLAELCDLSGVNLAQGPARMVGRAADQLSPFLARQTAPPAECPLPGYLGGDLRAPTGVEIHPGGWVNLCAGLALGNARERPLAEILADYDPDGHPIIRVLAQEGPAGLLRLAQRHGYSLPGGYVDGCHLCYQVRRFLRPHYPDHLAPAHPYSEGVPMTVLQLEEGIIYGPVYSRRLGRSLGVNLLPTGRKLCSFDCIYCHYGRTDVKTLSPEQGDLPSVDQVLDAVEEALRTHPDVDCLTFSGNGEPTLHPQFPTIAAGVRCLRDELRPSLKLVILSNAATVHLPHIRQALTFFDAPIMKLDAGDPRTFAAINRPAPTVKLACIVEGLKEIPGVITQTALVEGEVSNARGEPFDAWLAALAAIKPAQVQIYSTDRPVPEAGVEKVVPSTLKRIAREIEKRTGLPVAAYWA